MRALVEEGEQLDIPLTPLIDVVFLLLIFFLVATTFTRRENDQRVELPAATSGQKNAQNRRDLVVNLRGDGTLVVDGRVVNDRDLPGAVGGWRKENPDRRAQLRCDGRVEYRQVMRVMGIIRGAGIEKVDLPVRTDGTGVKE